MERGNGTADPQLLLRVLHDEKLGIERMADSARVLQRMLRTLSLSRDAYIAMNSISTGCEHLLRAYRDLSETAAQQSIYPVELDLCALVRRVTAQHMATALTRSIRLSFRGPKHALCARVDPVLMERLLSNLISNALRHARRCGTVAVKLSHEGGEIRLSVRDNGQGVARQLLPHIFEPYVTGPGGGSGLGLSNVKNIAVLHGGSVRCHTRQGAGTLMVVTIPVGQPE